MPTSSSQDNTTLSTELLHFTSGVDKLDTPDDILDSLHEITWPSCEISVLGALVFPMRWGDWNGIEKGKTVFLHKSVPEGWWNEHLELSRKNLAPGLMLAQLALAPFTLSETMRMLEPMGIDRWPFELALKYGIRDSLTCPVGGRWVLVYWSRNVLSPQLTQARRALLLMGATFAAIRLQKVIGHHPKRVGKGASLTPRELAVLRLLSVGKHVREAAEHLHLGGPTRASRSSSGRSVR